MKAYLDNAATTRMDERVLAAMRPFLFTKYGNASSLHSFGVEAAEALAKSRETIAEAVNADAEEIIFTSGGSESDNLAITGAVRANKIRKVATTQIEHPAVLNTVRALEKAGVSAEYLGVSKDALVSVEEVARAAKTAGIISVMHANNEVGSIQPIREIGEEKKKALFHVDAVQTLGKERIDVRRLNADMMSFSSHKLHGPKGVGALFVREGVRIEPLIYGGGHERGLRAGTENVAGAVGFAKAVELAYKEFGVAVPRMKKLRDGVIRGVLSSVPHSHLNGHPSKRLCNNAHFRFDRIEGEALVLRLDSRGVAASTGSACSSKSLEPSHVLLAMGLSHVEAHGSLRMTLSRFTTKAEADYAAKQVAPVVSELRAVTSLTPEMAKHYMRR
ncbi:cysteine desulfurase NifS [Candidatus Micrarchaeota archaeon CG08_land_8_20_14_0_20_59_11]|nr:MAG: cysteine desulfurase NifS [Candidatus Micrarchaeota archaeon CG08_land_8_20_14_0_20_59_11]